MNDQINTTAKQIGDTLIDLSASHEATMKRWSDSPSRPDNLSPTECVGFIMKDDAPEGLQLVADLQAPTSGSKATLRAWGITTTTDDSGNERFNNIQLEFDVDYTTARTIAEKGEAVARDDLRAVLQAPTTKLSRVTVSNGAGVDASGQTVGERYDVTADELAQDEQAAASVADAFTTVIALLKATA